MIKTKGIIEPGDCRGDPEKKKAEVVPRSDGSREGFLCGRRMEWMSPANKDEREGQTRKVDRSKVLAGMAVSDNGRGSEQLGGGSQAQWSTGARGPELQQWT